MATLREALGRLLTIPGVRAAALVGRDGLPIEVTGRGDERYLETLGAHGASALGTTEALGHDLGQGATVAALMEYEDGLVSVDPLGQFAAVVTLAESAASLGSIRRMVRSSRDELLRLLDMR
ncbi:MAG TPA: roadblock/LC7 domain-containing protein [Ktedonobacterales bacterium]|jgi:predicted regulator of Ras-like GTPase activity (Roadblock/LC7/MglB family)|nr:roadblock/LC7 domain-containing protein [Ktedonobacterales bacterium]